MNAEHTHVDHTHLVNNGKRELSLEELARSQPGMDRLMAELSPRMHRLYHAAKAGNWRLANYFLKSALKQLRLCAFARPKYADAIDAYLKDDCEPVRAAVRARDFAAFDAAYARMVERGNHYHAEFGKPYIVWRCPADPPTDLDLSAEVTAEVT